MITRVAGFPITSATGFKTQLFSMDADANDFSNDSSSSFVEPESDAH
jgi:hypothetical protein